MLLSRRDRGSLHRILLFHPAPTLFALPPWKLVRLTSDAGRSGFSALSPDGKLVAYSSDRSLDGERDLHIKQVGGGQPIRLTSDGAGNTTPDFSPDGSKTMTGTGTAVR